MPPSLKILIAVAVQVAAMAVNAQSVTEPVPPSPADRFGQLFADVQMRRLFADGKTFADASPKRAASAITTDYLAKPRDDAALRRFVLDNFDLPVEAPPITVAADLPLGEHIAALWPVLTRQPARAAPEGSLISLPFPYVVPGGRFREIYYWDSYFTMLGLVRDGRDDLVEAMIDDFTSLIERFGHIPNGTRSYYLSRSQPPFFASMVGLSAARDPAVQRRRLRALQAEHVFWMAGAAGLRPGTATRRVVALPDGSILNRYWDDRETPRDESWREDVLTARAARRPAPETYRDLRAAAESGWDFSSRWLGDGRTLTTIQTTAILPVDLNSLLYGLERRIGETCAALADHGCANRFDSAAARRRAAMTRFLWNPAAGRFDDYNWQTRQDTGVVSAAMLYPLFSAVATPAQAAASARTAERLLLAPGGLRTTTSATGQQWDRPNGWAPLQWIAVAGLCRYGEPALAQRIATTWLATVDREYRASGRLLEKYNVEARVPGGGGEYPLQDGFGWTNGVARELLARYGPAVAGSSPAAGNAGGIEPRAAKCREPVQSDRK